MSNWKDIAIHHIFVTVKPKIRISSHSGQRQELVHISHVMCCEELYRDIFTAGIWPSQRLYVFVQHLVIQFVILCKHNRPPSVLFTEPVKRTPNTQKYTSRSVAVAYSDGRLLSSNLFGSLTEFHLALIWRLRVLFAVIGSLCLCSSV